MISLTSRHRLERLIVTLDGSAESERALPIAISLAERIGVGAELLMVVQSATESGPSRERLRTLVRESGRPVESSMVSQNDDVANEVARRARMRPGTTVVMSSHGPRRTSGVLTESLAAELLADHLPLVIVGPRAVARASDLPVVACIDGSAESEQVLACAAEWAGALDVPLVLLIVASPRLRQPGTAFDPEEILRTASALIEGQWPQLTVRRHVVNYAWDVADALSLYLERHPSQLFAVATHLRSDWSRLVHPSATARIVHQLSAPVLVVPIQPATIDVPDDVSQPPEVEPGTPDACQPESGPFDEIILPIDAEHITPDVALMTARNLATAAHAVVAFLVCGQLLSSHTAKDIAKERLRSELTELVRPAPVRWRVVRSDADVADAIDAVAGERSSILCIDTGASGQLLDTMTPTIIGQIVRWSSRPVVLVGPRCRVPSAGYAQVVACIDGSLVSEAVAELAGRGLPHSECRHSSSKSSTRPRRSPGRSRRPTAMSTGCRPVSLSGTGSSQAARRSPMSTSRWRSDTGRMLIPMPSS